MLKRTLQIAILLSLLLHATTYLSVILLSPKPIAKQEIIEIDFNEAPAQLAIEKIKEKDEKLKQIAEQNEKAVNNDVDKEAKFLSRNNQKVIRQTVAQKRGEFVNGAGTGNSIGTGANPMEKFLPKIDVHKALKEKELAENDFDEEATERAIEKAKNPKQIDLRTGIGGTQSSQTLDYIKDIDPGLETMLSTKEFVFFSFYSRVRGQLQQHWNTIVRNRLTEMYKQGRTIASSDDKITKLLVTLDKQGQLVKVQIIGDSGVRDLDEAAVDAFRKAAPFPNPPTGMVDDDGTIKLRWDFILEASMSRPFRQPDAPHLDSENDLMVG